MIVVRCSFTRVYIRRSVLGYCSPSAAKKRQWELVCRASEIGMKARKRINWREQV